MKTGSFPETKTPESAVPSVAPGTEATPVGSDDAVDLADLMPETDSAPVTFEMREHDTPLPAAMIQPSGDLKNTILKAIMDHVDDAIYFKDRHSRFIMVNTALAKKHISASDCSQAIGRTDFDFFAQEHARKAYEDEQKIIATGKPLCGIVEKEVWPDGRITWVQTSKYPFTNETGDIIGTWGISRDITDRKRAEQDLESSEEQLRHAQKMEAFGQLAGGIAHDFNNMISVILGAAQLAEMDAHDGDSDLKKNIDMVIDTSKRAAELTQQLLAFARKGKYTIVPIDAHEVLQSVVRLISHTFDRRIRIVERLNAKKTTIMGDFAQMQNALLNLALNSRDAMPDGGSLTFETATVGPAADIDDTQHGEVIAGSYLRLRVTDTGSGMDAKTRARAFEPFFTTKEDGKGTGLGLASVYGTVKNFNGIIECDSELGKGTRFTLFLPLVLKAADKDSTSDGSTSRTKRLLIVDDEEDLRLMLSEMLESLGYQSVTCRDGVEAVEYYQQHASEIDALIVDLVMPRMGGHECIKRIKAINPAAIILISSGYNLMSDTQQIIAKGIAGFIQKPYLSGELAKILFESLGSR